MSRIAVPRTGAQDARFSFLHDLIDDAGMFPPARLPLDAAVARHALDRRDRPWLVGRFLCPASRLDDLKGVLLPDADWRVGVICDTGESDDIAAAAAFARAMPNASVTAVEVRLPGRDASAEIDRVCGWLDTHLSPAVTAYLEIPLVSDSIAPAVAALAARRETGPRRALAAKMRCGGTEPGAVPPVASVGEAIVACARGGVPLKATAGLHHPVRFEDPATGDMAHGFFNVVGASLLLAAGAIDADDVPDVLAEEEVAAFSLSPRAFAWRGHAAGAAEITAARASAFTGFGSCSIDEPVEDLLALGVLDTEAS